MPAIHFTYMAMIMFVLSLATMALVSAFAPPPPATVAAFRVADLAPAAARVGQAWVADHGVQSAALGLLTLLLILAFV